MDKPNKKGNAPVSVYIEADFKPQYLGDRFQIISLKGRGSYGSVYWAKDKHLKKKVAIKRLTLSFDKIDQTRRKLREIALLKSSNHPNIMKLRQVRIPVVQNLENFDELYLVTEYCQTDLHKLRSSSQIYESDHIRYMMYQIFRGLKYFHSASIVHRDLKPANILVTKKSLEVKICDLGLARVIHHQNEKQPLENQEEEDDYDQTYVEQVTISSDFSSVSSPMHESIESPDPQKIQESDSTSQTKKSKKKLQRQFTLVSGKNDKNFLKTPNLVTQRVTSRWYRAPEVILMEKNYDKQIDIWSAGCIFGQLLTYDEKVNPNLQQRGRPLFPGLSCFPVSPKQFTQDPEFDQLSVIFSKIEKPSEKDIQSLTDQSAKKYVKNLKVPKYTPLRQIFANAGKEALELLEGCLQFNPRKRLTAEKALQLPYFEGIRNPQMQSKHENFNYTVDEEISTAEELRKEFIKFISV